MNSKISRKKLKITKLFNSQKVISALITKNNDNNLLIFSPVRKLQNSFFSTKLKTETNDIKNYLTSSKINIRKKLKQNKSEYTEYNHNQTNNKIFYKLNTPFNKVKSLNNLSNINNNLINSNYSSHMTQTSISFFNNKERNKSDGLGKTQNIKNLELNNSFNIENKSNNVTYIEYHINQILSKKKEKNNNTNKETKLINNDRNFPRLMLKLNNGNNYNKGNNKKYFRNSFNNINIHKSLNNSDNYISNNEEYLNTEKFHINKIYFKDQLENLFHKIIVVKNNRNEIKNFVLSLTNEELKLLYENKDILPLLVENKNNYNFKKNLTEIEKSKLKDDKKVIELKNISFENSLLNLFLKGNKKPIKKRNFLKFNIMVKV